MKLLLVLLMLLISTSLYSQSDSLQNEITHSIQLFLVNDISAGYNHMLSENSAWNIALEIGGLFYYDDAEYKFIDYGSADTIISKRTREEDDEYERQNYNLVVLYKYYFYNEHDLKSHIATGPLVGYGIDETGQYHRSTNDIKRFEDTITLGISLNSGLEYAVSSRMYLLAEYRFDLTYSWISWKYVSKGTSKNVQKRDIKRRRYYLKDLRIGLGFRI